jgi:N-acetylmuramoyl-L-alanine amidase
VLYRFISSHAKITSNGLIPGKGEIFMWKWLLSFLGFYRQEEVAETKKKKVAIIVGHEASRKGARLYSGEYEYDYNSRIAKKLLAAYRGPYALKVFHRDHIGMNGVAQQASVWGAEISLELHLNASGIPAARGCEMLVIDKHKTSEDKAIKMMKLLSDTMGVKLRNNNGLKKLKAGDRGYKNLEVCKNAGIPIVLLIEPFFCDFETDESRPFIKHEWKYVQYLIDAINS